MSMNDASYYDQDAHDGAPTFDILLEEENDTEDEDLLEDNVEDEIVLETVDESSGEDNDDFASEDPKPFTGADFASSEAILPLSESVATALVAEEPKTRDKSSFTVFVVQSRLFYQENSEVSDNLIQEVAWMISNAEALNILFIFPDVQRISDSFERRVFNDSVYNAFLLDDILRFVKDKGSSSVFGKEDIEELKEKYGPCILGDGFYFDIEKDDLCKLKFIKASEA
ncbi:MAG: hypothetical protein LBT59_14820 [Clostridiales bacterium]|jgi:hypothetical protein|nr:hypothetical protein [Clostridiales bacterium]